MTEPTPSQLAAWRSFLEAHAAVMDVLGAELQADQDLPLSWYDVLVQLSEADEHRLRMQQLADRVLLSKSGLTRLVQRMEEAGLVLRQPCEGDRRGIWAVMTDQGQQRLEQAAPIHLDGVARHFADHLDEAEVTSLSSAMEKVRAAAREATARD